jgi:hypothetical protein
MVGIKVRVGVAVSVAEGTSKSVGVGVAGTGLELGIVAGVLLCALSGVEVGSLVRLQAVLKMMIPKRKVMTRTWHLII